MSDNQQQNEGGGLFSEDYEAPKRENPYLKKNREKAQKPEKKKPAKAAPIESPAKAPADVSADAAAKPAADEEEEGYARKRTFSDWMFEHVKLIATIATVLVVLSLVLITDVVGMVEDLVFQSQQAEKEELTLTYTKGLSEKSSPITWSDLERFRRDESSANDSITWMIPVKGTSYEVWISGVSTSKMPTYVYLYNMQTGDRILLGEENFDALVGGDS